MISWEEYKPDKRCPVKCFLEKILSALADKICIKASDFAARSEAKLSLSEKAERYVIRKSMLVFFNFIVISGRERRRDKKLKKKIRKLEEKLFSLEFKKGR
jgi:hypothetical protein